MWETFCQSKTFLLTKFCRCCFTNIKTNRYFVRIALCMSELSSIKFLWNHTEMPRNKILYVHRQTFPRSLEGTLMLIMTRIQMTGSKIDCCVKILRSVIILFHSPKISPILKISILAVITYFWSLHPMVRQRFDKTCKFGSIIST